MCVPQLHGRPAARACTAGIGVTRPGAFAEYIALPQTNVWVHKPDIDRDVASIFDPFGNATHSALAFRLGEDVGDGRGADRDYVRRHRPPCRRAARGDHGCKQYRLNWPTWAARAVNVAQKKLADAQAELGMDEG